jgi:hypothetical protein
MRTASPRRGYVGRAHALLQALGQAVLPQPFERELACLRSLARECEADRNFQDADALRDAIHALRTSEKAPDVLAAEFEGVAAQRSELGQENRAELAQRAADIFRNAAAAPKAQS